MDLAKTLLERFRSKTEKINTPTGTPSEVTLSTGTPAPTSSIPPALAERLGLGAKRARGNKVRSEKFRTRYFRLPKGAAWNPLCGFPKNAKCFCGSAVKFKKCCDAKLARAVNSDFAKYVNKNWGALVDGRMVLGGKRLPVVEKEAA